MASPPASAGSPARWTAPRRLPRDVPESRDVAPRWEELGASATISALVDDEQRRWSSRGGRAARPATATRRCSARPVQRRRAARGRGGPHLHRLRRRRAPAQRRARAVAARTRSIPRRGSGLVIAGLVVRPRGDRGPRRGVPLAPRRARGHRRLRADGARRAPRRRVIEALISDFGGVLTSPLPAASSPTRRRPGSRSRSSGARCRPRRRGPRRAPALRARARRDQRAGVRAPARRAPPRRLRPRAACASSTSSASNRTRR